MQNPQTSLTPAHLADAIAQLERPGTHGSILSILDDAARHIGGCDLVALIAPTREDGRMRPVHIGNSPLLTASWLPLCKSEQIPKPGQLNLIEQSSTTLLLVGTHAAGCNAVTFIWNQAGACDASRAATLRTLALAAALALRAEGHANDLQRSRSNFQNHVSELQHRLRNVLAFVRSIVRRTMESAESPEEFALHLEARISALSRIHAALNLSGGAGVEMQDLLRTELTANAVREAQFQVSGPSVRLRVDAAETLALAFHELVTNSLKFGALAAPGSRTRITWEIQSTATGSWLHFRWLETGAASVPRLLRRGFGRELIEHTLPYELGARTQFELSSDGLRCAIDLPLNARTSNSIFGKRSRDSE